MTWWLGGQEIREGIGYKSSPDGNVTVSTLSFVPSVRDAASRLVCRSGVMGLPESTLEDTWKLEVHCEYELAFTSRTLIISRSSLRSNQIMHLLQRVKTLHKKGGVFFGRCAQCTHLCAWLQSASPPIRLELAARARSCSPLPSPSPALSIPLWLTGLIPINPPRNNFPAIDRLTSAILRQEKTVPLGKRKDIKKLSNLLLAPLPFPLPPSSDEASAKLPGRMGPFLPAFPFGSCTYHVS